MSGLREEGAGVPPQNNGNPNGSSSSSSSSSPPKPSVPPELSKLAPKADQVNINDVFSTNRPKNVLAGASSGVKSLLKGTVCGVASLTVLPALGYKEDGIQGLAKGTVAGVLGCFGLVTAGVVVGTGQAVRGLYHTPEAMKEMISGKKRWDKETHKWVTDDLESERARMRENTTDSDIMDSARRRYEEEQKKSDTAQKETGDKIVADQAYYNVLGVMPTATEIQIKKAYYVKASKCHPDKCPAPEAKQQFQELSQAYQVLSDPSLRAKYDKEGKDAVNAPEQTMSPDVVYISLFGSEVFEPYIGKLSYSLYFIGDMSFTREELETLQHRREVRIALNLTSLLRPFVDGHDDAFCDAARSLAMHLSTASFGDRLLAVIGHEYQLNARHRLSMWDSSCAKAQSATDNIVSYTKIASSGYAAYKGFKKNAPESEEDVTSSLIEMAFEATHLDIAKTLANAVDKVWGMGGG